MSGKHSSALQVVQWKSSTACALQSIIPWTQHVSTKVRWHTGRRRVIVGTLQQHRTSNNISLCQSVKNTRYWNGDAEGHESVASEVGRGTPIKSLSVQNLSRRTGAIKRLDKITSILLAMTSFVPIDPPDRRIIMSFKLRRRIHSELFRELWFEGTVVRYPWLARDLYDRC